MADYISFYNVFGKQSGEPHLTKSLRHTKFVCTFTFPLSYFPIYNLFFLSKYFPTFINYVLFESQNLLLFFFHLSLYPEFHSLLSCSGTPKNVIRISSWLDNRWKFPLRTSLLIPLNFQTPASKPSVFYHSQYSIQYILSHHTYTSHLGKILVK